MSSSLATQAELSYAVNATGILTKDQSDCLGWRKLPFSLRISFSNATDADLSRFPLDWPEVEYEISSAPFGTPSFSTPENPIDVGYSQPVLLIPLSRSNISISSADVADPPLINPNWLIHPTDQAVAFAAFNRARQLFNTSAIAPILIKEELLPGSDLPEESSGAVILSYIQANIRLN
jgi:choline dehydrogenase